MATPDGKTAGLLEEPSHESQASSIEPHILVPAGSRKGARPDPPDALLSVITQRIQSTRHEDEWDLLGGTAACKLQRVHDDQSIVTIRIRIRMLYFLSNMQKYKFFLAMCTICEHTPHIIIYCVLAVLEQE